MKKFTKFEYLKNPNRNIIDQDSNPVKIVDTVFRDFDGYTNIIIINPDTENNIITRADDDGRTLDGRQLFFQTQTLIRWLPVYKAVYDDDVNCENEFCLSEEEADRVYGERPNYIGAFKVTITIP